MHARFVRAMEGVELPQLPDLPNLDEYINRLTKQATLQLSVIYNFVKLVEFFNRLKAATLPPIWSDFVNSIEIPEEILEISSYFNDEGLIDSAREPELYEIEQALGRLKRDEKDSLSRIMGGSKLREFLVDSQIHLYYGQETLLVRGGFSSVLKASVVGRSSNGFFYVVPASLEQLQERRANLLDRQAQIYQRYAKKFSEVMHSWWRFLQFINREFDRVDHYSARAKMLKRDELQLLLPQSGKEVVLEEFKHPAIKDVVPVSIEFKKSIMLVTGVNAGGKTMLLKSILASVFMSKYLIPFACNPHKTKVGSFDDIEAILDDPQSVKNDISTFAGRIVEFKKLFNLKDAIVGVDEIELGTDADEAAALFRVLLEELSSKGIKFIVTTHHKRLASLMATNESVDLVAAVYDKEKQKPTYTYLSGSIGKSYAFETAQRYGIDKHLVQKAREYLGEDKEKISELIEKSTQLEMQMRQKLEEANAQLELTKQKEQKLQNLKERLEVEHSKKLFAMEQSYAQALKKVQEALKKAENPDARRLLNEAYKAKSKVKNEKPKESIELSVGQSVKYRGQRAVVISLKSKEAMIDVNGMRLRVPRSELRASEGKNRVKAAKPNVSVRVNKPQNSKIVLKLLGKRADEAEEEVQRFLSDALVHGFNEVEIIHGTGSGVLVKVVSELLKKHPKVKSFERIKGNLGATLVKL
ncbi:MAG TPA: endonuclease MutS2 [Nitratifractor sp.]|nr:endonuclease MutS2 [Nitratifractor sp.]